MKLMKRGVALILILLLFSGSVAVPVCAADDIMHGVGYVTTSLLRLYSKPSSGSDILDIASEGECVVVISQEDDWSLVNYNLQEGYMLTSCLDIQTAENVELGHGSINSSVVYLRSGPGTEYSILSSGFRDNNYYIIGIENGWYKILRDNSTCYVRSDLLDLTEFPCENEDAEAKPQFFIRGEAIAELTYTESEAVAMAAPGGYYAPISGARILADAQKYIGTPYVFGGASPDGFDCSGLVYYVLAGMGYPAHRTARDQYLMGSPVKKSNLQPGDLVFFSDTYTSGISHVGIYAGNNKFLHAPKEGSSVCYSSLSGYWASHYHGARRLG